MDRNRFKFRAECLSDRIGFLKAFIVLKPGKEITFLSVKKWGDVPDVEVEIECVDVSGARVSAAEGKRLTGDDKLRARDAHNKYEVSFNPRHNTVFASGILPMAPPVDLPMPPVSDLTDLRDCMMRANDGHVMIETLNYAERYDGARIYAAGAKREGSDQD